jgi:hypothetical protein
MTRAELQQLIDSLPESVLDEMRRWDTGAKGRPKDNRQNQGREAASTGKSGGVGGGITLAKCGWNPVQPVPIRLWTPLRRCLCVASAVRTTLCEDHTRACGRITQG